MNRTDIEHRCRQKADELLAKHFPNFVHEAAVLRPETLSENYNDQLPRSVAAEFRNWLAGFWKEVAPEGAKPFDEVMNLTRSIAWVDESYESSLPKAREEAERVSLWERITKSNHEDVTYYKGLLKQYTEELLDTMVKDFMGDIQ